MTDLFTQPKPPAPLDPRVHPCTACGHVHAPCGVAGQWFCLACVPPSYWPRNRSAA